MVQKADMVVPNATGPAARMCNQAGTRNAEQHDADEDGFEEEGGHLAGEQRPGDIAFGLHDPWPDGGELERHRDTEDDPHRETEREDP